MQAWQALAPAPGQHRATAAHRPARTRLRRRGAIPDLYQVRAQVLAGTA